MTVWVTTYMHKHGEDIHVASTLANACRWVAETIHEWAEHEEEPNLGARASNALSTLTGDAFREEVRAIAEAWRQGTDEVFTMNPYEVDAGLSEGK